MKKITVECKSLGIPLTEEVARELDILVKTLPKDCSYRRKGALPDTAELLSGERADISMISTESVDREGDVILAKGLRVDYFARNPIVTFAHKYDELPVGRCAWVKKVSGGLRAKTVYTDAHELARSCWQCVQEGILRGKSIGLLPTRVRSPSKEEIARNPTWKNAAVVIESGILLEYAVAPIPVNQEALVEAVAKGYDTKTLSWMGLPVPKQTIGEMISEAFKQAAKELDPARIIEEAKNRYRA